MIEYLLVDFEEKKQSLYLTINTPHGLRHLPLEDISIGGDVLGFEETLILQGR